MEYALEVLEARGHENIRGEHETTFEITKEPEVTPRGDCIIGVSANKAVADLSQKFKELASSESSIIVVFLIAGNEFDVVIGRGDSRLTFMDKVSMVFRKSSYTCGRTVVVKCNKAAADINRRLVELLKDPNTVLKVILLALKP